MENTELDYDITENLNSIESNSSIDRNIDITKKICSIVFMYYIKKITI